MLDALSRLETIVKLKNTKNNNAFNKIDVSIKIFKALIVNKLVEQIS